MAGFANIKSVIPQESFISQADELLSHQDDPRAKFELVIDGAQLVAEQVGRVLTKDLVVDPPLSEEQIRYYQTTSQRIIGLGQKATKSIEQASASRRSSIFGSSKKGAGARVKG
jgi:hypothetical protein